MNTQNSTEVNKFFRFENEIYSYRNDILYIEDIPLTSIIEKTDTPVYIYSANFIKRQVKCFRRAFQEIDHKIFYAAKANFNISIIRLLYSEGCGIDVNSAGEFYRALNAGVNPGEMLLTGVGKTTEEIRLGLDKRVLMIKAESASEVAQINAVARSMGIKAPVALRVNPDVDAKTHPYISTGLSENKFGLPVEEAVSIFMNHHSYSNVEFTGIDMHIGSQITSIAPFAEAVKKLSLLAINLRANGVNLQHIDIGGGIGVRYSDENVFDITDLAEAILPDLKKTGMDVFFEPGRYLIANAGVLVTEVTYKKQNGSKNFLVVDAAMNDLLRPSIYGAYHHIQPLKLDETRSKIIYEVVGPVCESGDFLGKNRELQEMEEGEFLAVCSAGAYGMVMASNYNARRRPPEILVDGKNWRYIRRRETFEEMIAGEVDISLNQ